MVKQKSTEITGRALLGWLSALSSDELDRPIGKLDARDSFCPREKLPTLHSGFKIKTHIRRSREWEYEVDRKVPVSVILF